MPEPGPVERLETAQSGDNLLVGWQVPVSGGQPDRYTATLQGIDGTEGLWIMETESTYVIFEDLPVPGDYEASVTAHNDKGDSEAVTKSVRLE